MVDMCDYAYRLFILDQSGQNDIAPHLQNFTPEINCVTKNCMEMLMPWLSHDPSLPSKLLYCRLTNQALPIGLSLYFTGVGLIGQSTYTLYHKPGEWWEELAAEPWWLACGPAARLVTLDIDTLVLRLCEREEAGCAPAAVVPAPVAAEEDGLRLTPVGLFLIPNIPVLRTLSDDFRFGVEMNKSLPLSVPANATNNKYSVTFEPCDEVIPFRPS